jgi:F-type H+-transporting ATPase subunit delta
MSNRSLARRYAQALFLSSQEKNLLDEVEAELKMVVESIRGSEDLSKIIDRELIPAEEKKALMVKVFSGKISSQTMNFIKLVLDKKREKHLQEILSEFTALADTARNMLEAEVTTAAELSPQQQELLIKGLSSHTGKEVRLKINVDPSLLGGVMIKIGDKVYDGSARQQLQSLRERLESVYFEEDRGEIAT